MKKKKVWTKFVYNLFVNGPIYIVGNIKIYVLRTLEART